MLIVKDNIIRTKYHAGFEREKKPDELIIHGTAGPGTLNWMRGNPIAGNGKNYAEYYKKGIGLFHYLIERSGRVIEVIDPAKFVYHSNSGIHDAQTIGIELVNNDFKNIGHYTEWQYESLFNLFIYLSKLYKIRVVASHDRYREKYQNLKPKPCPGPLFNWDLFSKFLKANDFKFAHSDKYNSYWNIRKE